MQLFSVAGLANIQKYLYPMLVEIRMCFFSVKAQQDHTVCLLELRQKQ